MKILVICQYYYPEPFRINTICEELVRRGHEILVVTGEPNYPEGKVYEGYENHQHTDEVINGVRVHRCPIIPRKSGTFFRVLNYYSYVYKAKQFVVSNKCTTADGNKFDVILVYQLSPVMMAEPAIAYKQKYNVPVVLYCLDLWPESLLAGGIRRGSLIFRYFHSISKKIYESVERILVTSKMFTSYLENEFSIEESEISYLPQYAENLFEELPQKEEDGNINLVFAGNIGVLQGVETILDAAKELCKMHIFFHIVGSGTDLERLRKIAKENELHNVIFYGRRPLKEMPLFYANADAMLVTLKKDPILSLTLPGKVQSYMAARKPIIGAIDGETSKVIIDAKCGLVGPAEDSITLIHNIKKFISSEQKEKERMGKNARNFYEKNFSRKSFIVQLESILNDTVR